MAKQQKKKDAVSWKAFAGIVVFVIAASRAPHGASPAAPAHTTAAAAVPMAPRGAAGKAIAFARDQIGKPYLYGATGPDAFDCSGLVMQAWALPGSDRTSEEQWANLPHVAQPARGDLVLIVGSPIDPSPGHVGLVVDPARHLMIDAYGAGTTVRYDTYGPDASAPGLDAVVGYVDPAGATG